MGKHEKIAFGCRGGESDGGGKETERGISKKG